ncbi:hypothetical protein E4T39_01031 [Aureobasidium subglaciale]|nr:hypothetical protein E4T39_01031 [Aureobasidium subglaciale]
MSEWFAEKGDLPPCANAVEIEKKRARDDSANPEMSPAKRIKPARKPEKSHAKTIKPGPVCYMKAGRHEFIIKEAELNKSHTLHLLVNSDEQLDSDDEEQDVYRTTAIHGLPAAELSLTRHSEATAHVAWLFLRNGNLPDLKHYQGKWDLGEELRSLLQTFPDGGALLAATQLFDLGLGLRSTELQRAAYLWYQEARAVTWSSLIAKPDMGVWISTVWPEKQQRYDQYVAWLKTLKRLDTETRDILSCMAAAVEDGHAGICADLPELKQLEPASSYDHWTSDQTSSAPTSSEPETNTYSLENSDADETEVPSEDESEVPTEDDSEESEEE